MAFNRSKILSDDVLSDFNQGIELGIDNSIEQTRSKTSNEKDKSAAVKKKKSVPQNNFNADDIIKSSTIDYNKWLKYKKTLLIKPIEQLSGEIMNVGMPSEIVYKLNQLGVWHKSIHSKTILCNLIINFLEENKDIIELLDKEYNK